MSTWLPRRPTCTPHAERPSVAQRRRRRRRVPLAPSPMSAGGPPALALGYDLLAEEVVARMSIIEQRRPSATRLHPPREQRTPRYIDTPV